MHQQRARERARARERERERAIAEEKDMEEKLEAAIRSATACVKQVDQDVGEDPKISSSLESANSPRLHSIMAMSWQWCAGQDAEIAGLRTRLQEAELAPSPDCAHSSRITIQAGTDEMSYLSQKLSVSQKSLSEASHLLLHLVRQLKETSSALSEAQDLARGDMLREAEHNQLVRMHALALHTKHATLEARIEELSMQIVAVKSGNKQANILFDNLLLDHNDLVSSVQHQRQPSVTPSPLAPSPRPPSTPRPMTPRQTISRERAGAACRKACDACEDHVLQRGESVSEPKRMLEFVQIQALAKEGPNHSNDTRSAERPGGGVVTAEEEEEKKEEEEEKDMIKIQHNVERARQHAGEALLSLSVVLQWDATCSEQSVPVNDAVVACDGGGGNSRSHVKEGAPGTCMCLCVCIAQRER